MASVSHLADSPAPGHDPSGRQLRGEDAMRRFLVLAAAAAMLAACGDNAANAPGSAETAPATPALPKLTLAELPEPYNAANVENGRAEFLKCRNCHALDPSQGNLVGPNLHGMFDRPPGTAPKFRYSQPLQNLALERWTPEEVDQWLANPKGYLPGSSMFFNGIDKPESRRDVIAYLLIETR